MNEFLHQLLAGLATGGIYASVALALVMIYQATHHINFAQGEMAMFSTFIAWSLIQAGFPYWAAFALTVVLSFVLAAAIEFAVIRPMHNAPVLSVVVVFIGLLVIFHSLAGFLFGRKLTLRLAQKPGVMFCVLQKILCRHAIVRELRITRKDQILLDDLLRRATHLAFGAGAVEDAVDDVAYGARAVRFRTRAGFRGSHLVL